MDLTVATLLSVEPGSVSVAALRQDAAGLGELCRGDVEQGRTGHEGQQRQILLQLVQSGDGDDAVRVEQPVAEQDDQTLLLSNQVFKGLWWRVRTHRGQRFRLITLRDQLSANTSTA